jgi:hypothetical protein
MQNKCGGPYLIVCLTIVSMRVTVAMHNKVPKQNTAEQQRLQREAYVKTIAAQSPPVRSASPDRYLTKWDDYARNGYHHHTNPEARCSNSSHGKHSSSSDDSSDD